MPAGEKYLLDANVFIEACKHYYHFDICPGFWDALQRGFKDRVLCSIEHVQKELANNAKLGPWLSNDALDGLFKKTADVAVTGCFRSMQNWVRDQPYKDTAKHDFAAGADGWLAAYAKTNGYTVVTHEKHRENRTGRVPIPNLCHAFEVKCVNTFDMLAQMKVRFGLMRQ